MTYARGLLVNGELLDVDGLTQTDMAAPHVIAPASHGGPAYARLSAEDWRARPTPWVRQVIVHSTKGETGPVLPGFGAGGKDRAVAEWWQKEKRSSSAQLVVDNDGSILCLCDLATTGAWHAEGSSPWSIGIEMYQMAGGGIYEATLEATVDLTRILCWLFGIPEQIPDRYHGEPIPRMEVGAGAARRNLGGPNCVGVFGHRNNTGNRGRGDPGDEIFRRLEAAGFEALNFEAQEDLEVGRRRQATLNARDARSGETYRPLTVDGICGPSSWRAMLRHGFTRWRDVA